MPIKISRYSIVLIQLVMIILCVGLIYHYWPQLLFKAQMLQKTLHKQLTMLLIAVQKNEYKAGFMLIGLSFLYGVLHSAGPGHGKMVISTYLATQPTYYRQALTITLLSALLQGIVAIVLVILAVAVFSLSRHELGLGELWLERISYVLVVLLGIFICLRAIYQQFKQSPNHSLVFNKLTPLKADTISTKQLIQPPILYNQHHCGCGHKHLPSAHELKQANSFLSRLTMLLAIGIRPCSGAVLVLIFAKMLGIFKWGIFAVLAMSLGTALTISIIAIVVLSFRQTTLTLMRKGILSSNHFHFIGLSLALLGGIIMILFGLLFLFSTPEMNPILFGNPRE